MAADRPNDLQWTNKTSTGYHPTSINNDHILARIQLKDDEQKEYDQHISEPDSEGTAIARGDNISTLADRSSAMEMQLIQLHTEACVDVAEDHVIKSRSHLEFTKEQMDRVFPQFHDAAMLYYWLNYTTTITEISQLKQRDHEIVAQQPEFDFVVELVRTPTSQMALYLMQLPTEIRNYIMSIEIILDPGAYVYIPNKVTSNHWISKLM
mmetsp:Transcript_12509/g.11112  ORF Transcript_12509/g.11112 Transcript_12509/m.11112 type:complete len:209 (+) Transcript_12509:43-669(+)